MVPAVSKFSVQKTILIDLSDSIEVVASFEMMLPSHDHWFVLPASLIVRIGSVEKMVELLYE